ncbi:craniofacial development protein 1 isoform X3 [Hemiscyllium ocellatum]|uniref:craniofacial development protein 1 isoform X3 n=1 Tax=Hemiscyllium ocellatum TaxID=170820 RepID=UPI0029677131|nr:craniofacial development protein 1 isoform X3 [Hemiscyllium ocellatum]
MSDSESENYSSEEDEDYEPSADEDYSEDDVNDLVKEDNLDEDERPQKKKCLKKAGRGTTSRKRKQEGVCLQRDDVGGGEADELAETTVDEDLKEKKKADDLWASFLSDVGHKPKPVTTTPTSSNEGIQVDQGKLNMPADTVKNPEKPKAPGKVTITKVFDFAGEEIKVTKEVDAASKEAKTFLKNQNAVQEKSSPAAPAASETGTPTGSGEGCPKAWDTGETMQMLRQRMNGHCAPVAGQGCSFPVKEHFNCQGHSASDLQVIVFQSGLQDIQQNR